MLLLGSGLHRLSIDVDIVCPPGTDIEKYLTKFSEYGFMGRETIEREQCGTSVPKSHEKLHYRVAYLSQAERTDYSENHGEYSACRMFHDKLLKDIR